MPTAEQLPLNLDPSRPTTGVAADLGVDFLVTVDVDSLGATQHPHVPTDVSLLLPASSWWRKGMKPPTIPPFTQAAADCGGFVAGKKFGGVYPYSEAEYVEWLRSWPTPPLWAATRDLPVEAEFAADPEAVRRRQLWTIHSAESMWRRYPLGEIVWVPTAQGQTVTEYLWCLAMMHETISRQLDWYRRLGLADRYRIGIGSLCNRTDVDDIVEVVTAVVEYLDRRYGPDLAVHCWGVKNRALSDPRMPLSRIASVDSSAWNRRFGKDLEAINAEQAALGMTQRAYGYEVSLPRYLQNLAARLTTRTGAEPASPAATAPVQLQLAA